MAIITVDEPITVEHDTSGPELVQTAKTTRTIRRTIIQNGTEITVEEKIDDSHQSSPIRRRMTSITKVPSPFGIVEEPIFPTVEAMRQDGSSVEITDVTDQHEADAEGRCDTETVEIREVLDAQQVVPTPSTAQVTVVESTEPIFGDTLHEVDEEEESISKEPETTVNAREERTEEIEVPGLRSDDVVLEEVADEPEGLEDRPSSEINVLPIEEQAQVEVTEEPSLSPENAQQKEETGAPTHDSAIENTSHPVAGQVLEQVPFAETRLVIDASREVPVGQRAEPSEPTELAELNEEKPVHSVLDGGQQAVEPDCSPDCQSAAPIIGNRSEECTPEALISVPEEDTTSDLLDVQVSGEEARIVVRVTNSEGVVESSTDQAVPQTDLDDVIDEKCQKQEEQTESKKESSPTRQLTVLQVASTILISGDSEESEPENLDWEICSDDEHHFEQYLRDDRSGCVSPLVTRPVGPAVDVIPASVPETKEAATDNDQARVSKEQTPESDIDVTDTNEEVVPVEKKTVQLSPIAQRRTFNITEKFSQFLVDEVLKSVETVPAVQRKMSEATTSSSAVEEGQNTRQTPVEETEAPASSQASETLEEHVSEDEKSAVSEVLTGDKEHDALEPHKETDLAASDVSNSVPAVDVPDGHKSAEIPEEGVPCSQEEEADSLESARREQRGVEDLAHCVADEQSEQLDFKPVEISAIEASPAMEERQISIAENSEIRMEDVPGVQVQETSEPEKTECTEETENANTISVSIEAHPEVTEGSGSEIPAAEDPNVSPEDHLFSFYF